MLHDENSDKRINGRQDPQFAFEAYSVKRERLASDKKSSFENSPSVISNAGVLGYSVASKAKRSNFVEILEL